MLLRAPGSSLKNAVHGARPTRALRSSSRSMAGYRLCPRTAHVLKGHPQATDLFQGNLCCGLSTDHPPSHSSLHILCQREKQWAPSTVVLERQCLSGERGSAPPPPLGYTSVLLLRDICSTSSFWLSALCSSSSLSKHLIQSRTARWMGVEGAPTDVPWLQGS